VWLMAATLVIASVIASLIALRSPAQAASAGPPNPTWDRILSANQCQYDVQLTKPLDGLYEQAIIDAANNEGLTASDTSAALTITTPVEDCTQAQGTAGGTTGVSTAFLAAEHAQQHAQEVGFHPAPRAYQVVRTSRGGMSVMPMGWTTPAAHWIAGAIVGILVAGTLALLLPEAIAAAAASLGLTVSDAAAAAAAGCVAGAVGASLSEYLKGNGNGKITVQAITACIGGAAGGLANNWLKGEQAIEQAAISQASAAESQTPSLIDDIASSMGANLPELAGTDAAFEAGAVQAAGSVGDTLRRANSW
jgi:hypothetical protein